MTSMFISIESWVKAYYLFVRLFPQVFSVSQNLNADLCMNAIEMKTQNFCNCFFFSVDYPQEMI